MANLVGAEDDPRVAMTEKILKTLITLIDKTVQKKVCVCMDGIVLMSYKKISF